MANLEQIETLAILITVAVIGRYLYLCIFNVFFHGLAKFPGPILAKCSHIPWIHHNIRGDGVRWIVALHAQYGEVVRVAPDELSFSGADAFKDIYGHRKQGAPVLMKDPDFYIGGDGHVRQITNAEGAEHGRQRRIFTNAFSDRALKLQEPLFLTYVDRLIDKLRKTIARDQNHKFNLVRMLNFTTFDIMGDLTFGESLGMLDDDSYHPWVAAMIAGFHFGTYLHCIRRIPGLQKMLGYLIPASIEEKRRLHNEFSVLRVDRRLEKQDARPDIWGLVLSKEGEPGGLSKAEMYANANIFMIGGTETTATLLSGLTYHLLRNPDKMQTLQAELRSSFASENDITIEGLMAQKYLHACIEEGLRMYPPVSNGLPRVVPLEGAFIDGRDVPARTKVYVTHLAAYRNPENFKDPYDFRPERWMAGNAEYAADKKHALQPFSVGPRACLGKNMAYHEMRLILAKLIWNFDITLCPESQNWIDQKTYIMWDKGALHVQLSPSNATK